MQTKFDLERPATKLTYFGSMAFIERGRLKSADYTRTPYATKPGYYKVNNEIAQY